jgi:hypothetical protein
MAGLMPPMEKSRKDGDGCENSDVHINGRGEWERHCGNATLPKPERDVEERHS